MKSHRSLRVALLLLAACTAGGIGLKAQSYSIDWHKVAAGGGTSTNGQFTLSGTIGQSDAGESMANARYRLAGGFWALPTLLQTPGAPTLHITSSSPGWVTLWWQATAPDYILQESANLAPPQWVLSGTGTNNPVTIPAMLPARMYRLIKP